MLRFFGSGIVYFKYTFLYLFYACFLTADTIYLHTTSYFIIFILNIFVALSYARAQQRYRRRVRLSARLSVTRW